MSNDLSALIIDANSRDSNAGFHRVSNLSPVNKVSFQKFTDDLCIKLHISYENISISNDDIPITFFELVGFNDSYKRLFSEVEKSTTLSKNEIADIVRYKTRCDIHTYKKD